MGVDPDGAPVGRRVVLGLFGLGAVGIVTGSTIQGGLSKLLAPVQLRDPTGFTSLVPLGNTWLANLTSNDAGGNGFGGSITVPLTTSQQQTSGPTSNCKPRTDTFGYTYNSCTVTTTNYTLTQGSITY